MVYNGEKFKQMKPYNFLSEEEVLEAINAYANASEKTQEAITLFKVSAHPDTNEGRYGAREQGYVLVHSKNSSHTELFLQDFLIKAYGSPITFGMGGYAVENWSYEKVSKGEKYPNYELPFTIECLKNNATDKKKNSSDKLAFGKYVLLAVIEPLSNYEVEGGFIWKKWNHFTRKQIIE